MNTRSALLGVWVNQIRPHQLAHQLSVLAVMSGFFGTAPLRVMSAASLSVLGTLAMLLFSDYQHRHDDAAMGRRRLVHVLGPRVTLGGIAICLAALFGLSTAIGGVRCLGSALGVLAGTAVYTIAKKRHQPFVSYFGRFAAGVLLVSTYRAAFPDVPLPAVTRLAIAAGLLDLAGNLAGDLRDVAGDRRAGLRTLPLCLDARWTLGSIVALMVGAHGMLAGAAPAVALAVSALASTSIAVLALSWVPRSWKHAAVHGPKLLSLLVIGAALQGTPAVLEWVVCASVGSLWLMSYAAYLWSARAVCRRASGVRHA